MSLRRVSWHPLRSFLLEVKKLVIELISWFSNSVVGATTFDIMTLSIITHNKMTFSIMPNRRVTFVTFGIMTYKKNDI